MPSARIITGANVENAAYPIGTCAERVALGSAVGGLGLRRGDFAALAVVADTAAGSPVTPCGMCRQALREFCEVSPLCCVRMGVVDERRPRGEEHRNPK